MRNFPQLEGVVQRNCDISDARYAGEYGLCTFLLKMREYYRWANELPFASDLPRDEVGNWLQQREARWRGIETEEFAPLPLSQGALDPFDADAASRELLPLGYVYSAGYGIFRKPVFFLGQLSRVEERSGYTIVVSSREYARELAAPPAMLRGRTIFLRLESLRRYLWEKIEEWRWRKQGGAMARALASYDFIADTGAALDRMSGDMAETLIQHEIGEAQAGELLGEGWSEMMVTVAGTPGEPVARAVRDLLADCLSTLPALLRRADQPALHFYFATFDGARRRLFPQALEAYEHDVRAGAPDRLWQLVGEGKTRWLDTARRLLTADPAVRDAELTALR